MVGRGSRTVLGSLAGLRFYGGWVGNVDSFAEPRLSCRWGVNCGEGFDAGNNALATVETLINPVGGALHSALQLL